MQYNSRLVTKDKRGKVVRIIDANELKEYIRDNNYIEKILIDLGCHDIKENQTEWRAALPQKTNKTAVCVKKDTLSVAVRSSDINTYGDIFTLVMTLKNLRFGQANKYLHNLLGLKYTFKTTNEVDKVDVLAVFKRVKRQKCLVNEDIPVYDSSCLKEYTNLPYIGWIREGIMPNACKRFNIGYSYDRKRIVIPERKWDGDDDEYIGISGRTTVPNYELFDIPKYTKLSKTYPKGQNIYGLNENYKSIQEAGYVCVYESQKSVLKRYSLNDRTGVAIGNCELTEAQVRILISLNVEIVISLDEGISLDHTRKECEKFYKIRRVSYIYDKWDLIEKGSKDSPADIRNKAFQFLFKHRTMYDDKEHELYMKSIKK